MLTVRSFVDVQTGLVSLVMLSESSVQAALEAVLMVVRKKFAVR